MPRKFQHPRRRPNPKKKFKKRKPAYARRPAMRVQREIKSIEMTSQTYTVSNSASGEQQMTNGVLFYPGPWNTHSPKLEQGTGCTNNVIGCFLTPRYCVQRMIINFASLTGHADLSKGVEFRCRYGFVKNTGMKVEAAKTSVANWCTSIDKMVHKQIQDSGMDDNFLTFSQRNRAVSIVGDFRLKPDLRRRVADTDSQNHDFAPPKNIQIDWHKKKGFPTNKKQRVTSATDGYVLHNTWVPFVYISSNNITTNMGALDIHTSSKFYFTDS